MKNTAIGDRPQISDVWRSELGRFDADMRRRGAAERTRSAYGADLEEFARWATALGLSPSQIGYPILRRYAAALSERRAAPATVARLVVGAVAVLPSGPTAGHLTYQMVTRSSAGSHSASLSVTPNVS